jgi:eukaryotic-like serine/threonine-protein kinase
MDVGDSVGSYRLVQKLGEGGMGVVYLAEHKYIARRAAIKFLLPDLTGSAEVVERFFAEARAVSLIQHPGIVEVIDCELRADGRAYIVMEHLQGESLRAYLERLGKLDGDPASALAILRQIASALAAAHAQGIVHRDLKPDNVFLHLPTGRSPAQPVVKVLDFGIAKLLGGAEGSSKTRTGQLLGTPLYMSPEQCRGARSVDGLSDVYSLGCIMYELLCGRPPFQAEGFGDLIIAHVSLAPPEPRDLAPSMAPLVRQTLLACLAKDPRGRPPSMERLASLLSEAGAPEAIALRRPVDPGAPLVPLVGSSGARPPVPAAEPRRPAAPAISPPDPVAQTLATPSVAPPTGAADAARSSPAKFTTLGEAASQLVETPAKKNRARTLVVGLIGALALAGVGVMLTSRGRATAPTPTSQTPTPVAQPPAANTAPETASIDLTDLPPSARVRMDGQVATLPLLVPRGGRSHAVIVDADGFEPLQLSVDGARDRTIAVEMKKKVGPVPTPPPAAEPSAVKSHHRSEHRHGSPTFKSFTDL